MHVVMSLLLPALLPLAAGNSPPTPFKDYVLQGSSEAMYVEDIAESVFEAAMTLGFFFAVWAGGKVMIQSRRPASSKAAKVASSLRNRGPSEVRQRRLDSPPTADACAGPADAHRDAHRLSPPPRSAAFADRGRTSAPRKRSALAQETDILATAVRNGEVASLPEMLLAAVGRCTMDCDPQIAQNRLTSCLVAVLRACAAKRYFHQALDSYDVVASRVEKGSGDAWSLLLWCAVEANECHRCSGFLQRLCAVAQPSRYDIVNLVHYCVNLRYADELVKMLKLVHDQGCRLDVFARNRALAICTAKGALELAEVLLDCGKEVPMDTIAYNTLMKGYASARQGHRCLQLYGEMRREGLIPSDVTFGILLDACIDAGELEHAKKVFYDLQSSGFKVNVVLCTTFIKGLAATGNMDEALEVLTQMEQAPNCRPDVVTYATVAKGYAQSGDIQGGVQLIERMTKEGVQPDAAVFHTVLGACSSKVMPPAETMRHFERLVSRGMRPSLSAVSILLKSFAKSHAWKEALSLLEGARENYRLNADARLYVQLARASAEDACGGFTLEVYASMLRIFAASGLPVDRSTSMRVARLCAQVGEEATSTQLHNEVCKAEGFITLEAIANIFPVRDH